ncbi:MAG: GWxTD domain-containing protein, partial [Candidatus Aminicenantes bacterium]|nr:GWxTD domain-containing protein [Candidatus Aminicenantes bacterium]
TPGTARNEFRDEHYRRLAFADKTFGRGLPFQGGKTDRGRIYIALGPPLDVQRYMSPEAVPMELWTIRGQPGLGQMSTLQILFYQRGGAGDYVIYNPVANSPKDLVQTPRRGQKEPEDPEDWDEWDKGAMLVLRDRMLLDVMRMTGGAERGVYRQQTSIMLAEVQANPQRRASADYALAILEHRPVVDVSYSVKHIGNRTAIAVLEDGSGTPFLHYVLVPETVSLDRYGDRYVTELRITLRLADATGATVFQQEKSVPLDLRPEELKRLQASSFQYYDAVPVIPGKWLLSILLENTVSKEFTSVGKTIEVAAPDGPAMSPLVLARRVFKDAPAEAATRAFQVGRLQLYPSVNNVFPEKQPFFAFLQLRGLTSALKEKGAITFVLSGDGKPLWSVRRTLREYADPGTVIEEISVAGLAAATYQLRAGLADESGREILAAQTDVRLTGEAVPGVWVSALPLPPAGDPAIDFMLGTQALNAGRIDAAVSSLAKAARARPDNIEYAVGYARALLAAKDPSKARDVLLPLVEAKEAGFDFFEICHAELGEKDKALAAWKKSLAIMPNQEAIKARILEIR